MVYVAILWMSGGVMMGLGYLKKNEKTKTKKTRQSGLSQSPTSRGRKAPHSAQRKADTARSAVIPPSGYLEVSATKQNVCENLKGEEFGS